MSETKPSEEQVEQTASAFDLFASVNPEPEAGAEPTTPKVLSQQEKTEHPRAEEEPRVPKQQKDRVLAALVDGSESADNAFECALRYKQAFPTSTLYIVHASEIISTWSPGCRNMRYVSRYHIEEVNEAIKKLGHDITKAYSKTAIRECGTEHSHSRILVQVLVSGTASPKEAAIEFIRNQRVDDVFVGTRGLSPSREHVLGSFSKFIVDACPSHVTVHLSK